MNARSLSPLDRLLSDLQRAMDTVAGAPAAERPNPAQEHADIVLDDDERRHAAGLMRINHVGEVCAQALYCGQAAVARDGATLLLSANIGCRLHLAGATTAPVQHPLEFLAARLAASTPA